MANTGAWIVENCTSIGYDDLTLNGAVEGYTHFSEAIPQGDVWYSIKDANGNREEGIGYFDGSITIVRTDVHITYEDNVYTKENATPIYLSGKCIVSCTLNATALSVLLSGVTTPVVVAPNEPIYRLIDDFSETNTYYKGWSDSASSSAATWKILKGVESPEGVFTETWADGDELEDNIWDDRLTLVYS